MDRDLTVDAMVQLPRTNASSAAALAEQLLTAASAEKGGGLPVFIERPRTRLEAALLDLKSKMTPQEAVDSLLCKSADRAVDGAWRSFFNWTDSLTGMAKGSFPEQDKMLSLKATVFKDGLSFIILAFREEWTQSETRLQAIADGGFEPLIEQLGGGPFLKNLKAAHAHYGEVLGIKAPIKVEENPIIRPRFLKLLSAIKSYVLKAVAYADPEEAGSEMLSSALLLPLSKWKDTVSLSKKSSEEATEGSSKPAPKTSAAQSAR